MSVILATAGYDHKIRFWEAPSGICSRTIRYPDSQVNCLEITPDKQFLAAGGNPHIRLFDINNTTLANPVLALDGHTSSVTSLGFQRDGRYLYSGSEDGTVKLWDLRSPTYSRSFDSHGPVNSVALHPNQAEIISGDQNGSVKIWDLGTSRCINEVIPDGRNRSGSIGGGPGAGAGAGAGGDSSTSTKKAATGTTTSAPSSSSSPPSSSSSASLGRVAIQAVAISDDCRTLIAASNHADVYVWDPTSTLTLKPKCQFRAHPAGTYLLRAKVSPDCRRLVTTSSDKTARLWDTSSWELTQTLARHNKWVWDAVFSADSSYLVTASSDHTAKLWNLRTGEVVRQYTGHQTAVTCVALNDSST